MTLKIRGNGIWIRGPFVYWEEDSVTGKRTRREWADDEVEFLMIDLDQCKLGEYNQACTKRELLGGQVVRSTDQITLGWLIFNEVVRDWKGILDETDKPLPCDETNRRALFNTEQAGIEGLMDAWREAKQAQDETLEKNSSASSGTESTTPRKTVAIAGSGKKQTG